LLSAVPSGFNEGVRTHPVVVLVAWICYALPIAYAQPKPELRYVAIVSRHGVRSPTGTAAQLNQYSAAPWPDWGVAPGELTAHGAKLMRQFGAWYRSYLASQGLLNSAGCGDTGRIYVWADTDQRTRATADALADGMAPGCPATVHALKGDANDPLFNPLAAGIGHASREIARAAVLGRVGNNPQELAELYRPAFAELGRILGKPLAVTPIAVTAGQGDNLVDITGTLRIASTLTENLLLEYANGMTGGNLGWGRLNAENLRRILVLHTAYADLARRTPYLARARGSNLLARVLDSLRQAASGKAASLALGKPGDRVLVIAGHDTNLSNISGMLGLSWVLSGHAADDTPPGGALVFELWRTADAYSVRTYYTAQTLGQMHRGVAPTLAAPPLRAPVFIPGCGTAAEGFACEWGAFEKVVEASIDRSAVR
jgi:4-phytase/acid phosphatase